MEKHVNVIAILWIVYGAIGLLFGFFLFLLLFGISFIPDMGDIAPGVLRLVAVGLSFFFLIFSLPELIAGIGLLKKQEWGRILTLVVSFFNLLNIPLGTALGIYSLIVLLKDETIQLFMPKPIT